MPVATIQGIDRKTLSTEESNALDILDDLAGDKVNKLKELMELEFPGIIGPSTLVKFFQLCKDQGFDLSDPGVNAFKDKHRLGNTGVVKGVIGPQTAEVYFSEIIKPPERSPRENSTQNKANRGGAGPLEGVPPQYCRINQAGIDLVKEFEGLHRKIGSGKVAAYLDPVNIPTIGYGHTRGVYLGQLITEQGAEDFLRQDLDQAESGVSSLVDVSLNENQFSALVSFAFNVGAGALAHSTLLKLLNSGDYKGAANQFPRWDKAGGQALPGLTRRRVAERKLFLI